MTLRLGSPEYMAPELVKDEDSSEDEDTGYDCRVDVWAVGVILYFLLSAGKTPFIESDKYSTLDEDEFKQLLKK